MQMCPRARRQLVRMLSQSHLKRTPRESRSTHRLVERHELHAIASLVGQHTPAYVLAVAHALRLREVDKLILDRALVLAHERASLAVSIVVERTTTIISVLVILGRHLESIAQTWEVETSIAAHDAAVESNRTIGIDSITHSRSEVEIILGRLTTILQALHRLASLARTPLYTTLTWSLAYDIIHEADATIRIVDGNRGCRSLVLQIIKPLLEPLVPRPVVVVHRSTESIELEAIALLYHIVVAILESVEATISIVESSSKVDTLDDSIAASGVNPEDITTIDKERLPGSHNAERQLLVHLHIASLSPRHIASQAELYVEEILTIRS